VIGKSDEKPHLDLIYPALIGCVGMTSHLGLFITELRIVDHGVCDGSW
jgi:hypothetical protein